MSRFRARDNVLSVSGQKLPSYGQICPSVGIEQKRYCPIFMAEDLC